jgi:mRNA-degrading endonuclease RelE of RelBE toxin-antitoxin system
VTPWQLALASSAERTLARLSDRLSAAVVEFLVGPLLEAPERVGKPLRYELEGYWSARRGAYRIIYRLDNSTHTVRVVRIDHRSEAYRPR